MRKSLRRMLAIYVGDREITRAWSDLARIDGGMLDIYYARELSAGGNSISRE